jgi:hypothetical protein
MAHYRNCLLCGGRFSAKRITRNYCSDACRLKWHRSVWNDPTGGQLSTLLRRVADSIDNGLTVRSQFCRLMVLLRTYDRVLTARETAKYLASRQRRIRKESA